MGDNRCSDPCKLQACDIQDCLKANGYNEAKCTRLIDTLYQCCRQFYEDNGAEARTVCCPKPKLLELKLEQRKMRAMDARLLEGGGSTRGR